MMEVPACVRGHGYMKQRFDLYIWYCDCGWELTDLDWYNYLRSKG